MRLLPAALALALVSACATSASTSPSPSPPRPAAAATAGPAEGPAPEAAPARPSGPGWRWLYDGGAVPFLWGSAALAATAFLAVDPPADPRVFASDEGGLTAHIETVPNWTIGLAAASAPLLVFASGTDARWYHTKGMAQSVLTTAALTELAKNTFGRRRPRYTDGSPEDDRKSFFSGHSSLTWTITTYGALYLHDHVFARWRGERAFAWWEVPAYAGLAAAAVWVPYTRVDENYHHLSDVVTGAAVGAGLAIGFYAWQERRYRRDRAEVPIMLVPTVDSAAGGGGLSVVGRF